MSQENVELVRRAADAFNRGDIDALLEELDPEIEWHPLLQVLFGGEATDRDSEAAARVLDRAVETRPASEPKPDKTQTERPAAETGSGAATDQLLISLWTG